MYCKQERPRTAFLWFLFIQSRELAAVHIHVPEIYLWSWKYKMTLKHEEGGRSELLKENTFIIFCKHYYPTIWIPARCYLISQQLKSPSSPLACYYYASCIFLNVEVVQLEAAPIHSAHRPPSNSRISRLFFRRIQRSISLGISVQITKMMLLITALLAPGLVTHVMAIEDSIPSLKSHTTFLEYSGNITTKSNTIPGP